MDSRRPKDIDGYKEWLGKEHGIEVTGRTAIYYDSVASVVKRDFDKSDFWKELTGSLREFDSEYQLRTGYPLFFDFTSEFYIKPFDSFLLKTFRKNILENERWPDTPEGGWILPDNWYSRINDIVRTLFVVKYLDGVEFIMDKIRSLCTKRNLPCDVSLEAREEGYYAAHLYTKQEFEIPRVTWDTERVDVSVEIQITTQLQDVIRKLLHKYYERRREVVDGKEGSWQWDYRSDEFVANYLGHVLHFVEGMIVEVRERQKERIT